MSSNRRTQGGEIPSRHPRTILGYAWPWTARAGDAIDFKVSTYEAGSYRADLVRLICADDLSDPAMFKEEELTAPFAATYSGRLQNIYTGSYVEITSKPCLDMLLSFTVQAMVFPTALPMSHTIRTSYWPLPDPFKNQHLISRWDESTSSGWSLLIDESNSPALLIGNGQQRQVISLGAPLLEHHWFFVVASYDATNQEIRITAKPEASSPCGLLAWKEAALVKEVAAGLSPSQRGPLRIGAAAGEVQGRSRPNPIGGFNGRLDRVRLCKGIVDDHLARTLAGTEIPQALRNRVVGFWDFSRGIDTVSVYDRSENGLEGITVNLPTRAVTGIDWDGSASDWRHRPDHYSAIHFHDDDLYDAEWETDFSYCVPETLPSGIYAARLRHGASEDYIPFFVAPPEGSATARVALLIPTATYTAYANQRWDYKWKVRSLQNTDRESALRDPYVSVLRRSADSQFLARQLQVRAAGKGIYLTHTDGTYCNTASQKFPNMAIKPKTQNWALVADTYITDWLEQCKVEYDIITDDLLQSEGTALLNNYRVVVTGNHPEYCSSEMLDAIAEYQRAGGRWMYLGGNGYCWVTSFHSQLRGALEVRKDTFYLGLHPPYETRHAFDGRSGGLWSNNGRQAHRLMGVSTEFPLPFEGSVGYGRLPDSYDVRARFIFAGVQSETFGEFGIIGDGAAGQEVDALDYASGTPAHALHLARSHDFPWPLMGPDGLTAEEFRDNVKMPRADMVFFEAPAGGAVFSVGSMAWVGALSHNRYDNDVSRITLNVLRRFMDEVPFPPPDLRGKLRKDP